MVQNTIGRIYLDNHPAAVSEFKPKWTYLVESSEPTPKESIYKYKELTDLLVGDLACGSGHILNECFDILYDLYIYEGYSRREAIENIFTKNLRGVDLDTRAKQLAMFALMLKACQKDSSFADAHVLPHVLSMPTPIPQDEVPSRLLQFFRETPSRQQLSDLTDAFELMQDADSLGSIMKFDVTDSTLLAIRQALDYWNGMQFLPEELEGVIPAMELIQTLTDKYAALVMNPPYMGSGNMNETLSNYVKRHYEIGKADLYSTFMLLAIERLNNSGRYGMINMHSWMFISSFERLRRSIIDNYQIESLLHLGTRTFDELSGEVVQNSAFVINKSTVEGSGTYYRLVDGRNCTEKDWMFINAKTQSQIYYPNVKQKEFEKIPGSPVGYWVSENTLKNFVEFKPLSEYALGRVGLITGDSNRFIKNWNEVNFNKIGFNIKSNEESIASGKKWFPIHNGGTLRKWYGNLTSVVNWENDGDEMKNDNFMGTRCKSHNYNGDLAFKESFSWNTISTEKYTCRYAPIGFMFDTAGPFGQIVDVKSMNIYSVMGFLNSKIANLYLSIVNPTINFPPGCVLSMPISSQIADDRIKTEVKNAIELSKLDWDSHETSWDFDANPLVALRNEKVAQGNLDSSFRLSDFVEEFETQWTERFNQLHENEEELNRQFIEIYGLQDELTPEVPMDEITILQQGEINIENNEIEWHTDVLMKQLISYAVGVWMGRYCLNKKGLHIAHPQPTAQELQEYWYGGVQVYIDDDGLIPILPQSSPFEDNLVSRIADFVRITFGEDKLTENLNYIEQQLGQTIEQYLLKDFWKDHKKMYQNRPIYWLFSSKKGAFKCLAYMHRMDAYTAERVRNNYLLPYIEYLQNQIADLENRASSLSTAENRKLQNLQKILDECREYHERLQVIAEQAIAFDLDDGVVVNYAKFGDILAKIK